MTRGRTRDLRTLRLDDLEGEVFGLADRVSRCMAESLLQEQADRLGEEQRRCPCCHRELVPKPSRQRRLQLRRGEAQREEPVWWCPSCRRDFFPQSAAMGCAVEAECSPAVEAKVVSASTRDRSYEEASADLQELAELDISAKRWARMTQLQLCCDHLSDTTPLIGLWKRRASRQTGFHKARSPN